MCVIKCVKSLIYLAAFTVPVTQYFILLGICVSCLFWVCITVFILHHVKTRAMMQNTDISKQSKQVSTFKKKLFTYLKRNIISILIISENNNCFFISDTWLIFKWAFFVFSATFYVTISLSDTGIISSVYIKNHDLVWRAADKITPNP